MIIMNIEKYLLKKLNPVADDVVIHSSTSKTIQTKFVNNRIITTKEECSKGISIFVSIKKKLVSTSIRNFSKSSADSSIREIVSFAKFAEPNPDFNGIAKGPFKYKTPSEMFDAKVIKVNSADIVGNTISIADKYGCRVSGVFEVSDVNDSILTSNKVEANDKGTSLYLSARCFKDDGSGHNTAVSRVLKRFDYKNAVESAAELAVNSKNPQKVSPGRYSVLFHPLSFANLMNHVGDSCSVFSVESGLSFFRDKLNQQVASDNLSVYDDGLIANGLSSSKFDSEGYPTQRTELISNGVLKNYLHNTSTAIKYKTKSTGNAGLISPSPHNIVVSPGDRDYSELIKGMKKGLIVSHVWYTRFQNYSTGDFSTLPRDATFLVENGRIVRPIKNIRISENLLNMLKNVKFLGKDTQQAHSWDAEMPVFTPSCVVENVNITMPE